MSSPPKIDPNRPSVLRTFVRYHDLKKSGIVRSWQQLGRMISDENFPAGILLSAKVRAWPVNEIETWLESRPSRRVP